jgi:DNA repair exonuclease SbcCD ATPase subunit
MPTLTFEELIIRNFLSYGNVPTTIKLNNSGIVLIAGTNGVGKSSIIRALMYCLYDDSLSANTTTVDELINNINEQDMIVSCSFYKLHCGYYKVSRARKMKGHSPSNFVKLYHNPTTNIFDDVNEITLDSNKNTDKLIIDILGKDCEMFIRTAVISTASTAFLSLPVQSTTQPSQTSFIEQLFGITCLADKAVKLKKFIKTTDDYIKLQSQRINYIEQEQQRLTTQINNAKEKSVKFDENRINAIQNLEAQLLKISEIDFTVERQLLDEAKKINSNINILKQELQSSERVVTKIKETQSKIINENESLHNGKCPYCKQSYINNTLINDNIDRIVKYENEITELNDIIVDITTNITQDVTLHSSIVNSIKIQDIEELINIQNQSDNIKSKIQELHSSTNVYLEQLNELEQIVLDSVDYDELNKHANLQEHQQFLLKLLTKKDSFVRRNLLNANLQYLNSRIQVYLNDLGLPFNVKFTSSMTAEISRMGRKLTFANLSNGQRSRVSLALTVAFIDIQQRISGSINISVYDEVICQGLDRDGMFAAINMLKHKSAVEGTTTYIITHREDTYILFDNVMHIDIDNGFSKITYNA